MGTKDCFSPTEFVDYFYTDSKDFLPCLTDCKRCTGSTDCQVCGRYTNPSQSLFLIQNTSPHKCVDSCDLLNYRYVLPPGQMATCIECTSTTYYLEGSNPPQCSQCNTAGFWLESSSKLCKPCGNGCAICSNTGSCLTCVDSVNGRVQTSGGGCASGC